MSAGHDEHQHWSPEQNRFVTHAHLHSGPHRHEVVAMNGRAVVVTVSGPGNYAPLAHALRDRSGS